MSNIRESWKYWPLKDGFRSISQKSGLQNIVLSSLLLLSCACYEVNLDDIQWYEVATSTTHNFNNSWPLYLYFSNMLNLCPSVWFKYAKPLPKCLPKCFGKGAAKKTQISHIFKGLLFRNVWPYWYEYWRILRDFC